MRACGRPRGAPLQGRNSVADIRWPALRAAWERDRLGLPGCAQPGPPGYMQPGSTVGRPQGAPLQDVRDRR